VARMLIAGNWKMNLTKEEAVALTSQVVSKVGEFRAVDVVLCPALCYIPIVQQIIRGTTIHLGAQNCYAEPQGAYTGEVSAAMLESLEVQFCIVGHSERRRYFHEDDALIAKKVDALLEESIWPILCIGETLEERKSGKTWEIVSKQLTKCLKDVSPEEVSRVAIAYEPVWAIGTGESATPQQAEEIHGKLREHIKVKYGAGVAEATRIIYGGSVDVSNAQDLLSQQNINGALVGGASLKADDFAQIVALSAKT
jgi:triosephosphate isomerase